MAIWQNGKLMKWQVGKLIWLNDLLSERLADKIVSRWNGRLITLLLDQVANWENGSLTKGQVDEMARWWKGLAPCMNV